MKTTIVTSLAVVLATSLNAAAHDTNSRATGEAEPFVKTETVEVAHYKGRNFHRHMHPYSRCHCDVRPRVLRPHMLPTPPVKRPRAMGPIKPACPTFKSRTVTTTPKSSGVHPPGN